ncbi:3,4-dihydroxy-2-butanone-4-phosphate synthase [Rhodococcoides kyotonense]|nr:3,4-dihydroxy-2-butanone-4-phosphate synthase [Rhodococcus kyotonensis]
MSYSVDSDVFSAVRQSFATGEPIVLVGKSTSGVCMSVPAANVTAHSMAQLVKYSSGLVRTSFPLHIAHQLYIPTMSGLDAGLSSCVPTTVTVDALDGTTTGISAHDRAITARQLAAAGAQPEDFSRPGHMVTKVVDPQGAGSPDLAMLRMLALSGYRPIAVLGELVSVSNPHEMMFADEAVDFALEHNWPIAAIY